MKVVKRDGSVAKFNIEKINKIISWAVDGIQDVSFSEVEINAKLNLVEHITTK